LLASDKQSPVRLAMAAAAIAWAVVIPLAAWSAGQPDTASPARVFALTVYQFGSVICHQRPERSFHLAAVPLPVCARCTGIYVGAAVVLAALSVGGVGRARRSGSSPSAAMQSSRRTARAALLFAVTPALLTLAYEWITDRTPSNEIRAATGAFLGAIAAWVLWRVE
jgi:uncharacterized membrane protein